VALAFLPAHLPRWLWVSTVSTLGFLSLLVVLGGLLLAKGKVPAPGRGEGRIRRMLNRLVRVVRNSLQIARDLLRTYPRAVFGLFPITMGLLATKAVYTYLVFRAFEPTGHFEEMVAVLVIFVLTLFFAPTPGATGVAEGAGTAFLVTSLGTAASVGFVLYWRMLTLYIPVLVGGLVLLHQLGRDSRGVGRLDTPEARN
jgi:uncharacterized protein (TIRG00374 family)